MSLLANSNAIESGGYNIDRSLRFRSSASAYLSRTPASASNQQKWTWSGWVKVGALGGGTFFAARTAVSGTYTTFNFFGNNQLVFQDNNITALQTSAVFRDPSAWYHFVCSVDTTQATSSNRIQMYVNGVLQSISTGTYPTQNTNLNVNSTATHLIGQQASGSYFDGYLAEVNFIDGQALTPSSFGQTDLVTGVWTPKKYTGTYGTNGFYLPFSDNTSPQTLCYDKSGTATTVSSAAYFTPTGGVSQSNINFQPSMTIANMYDGILTGQLVCSNNPVNSYIALDAGQGNSLNLTKWGFYQRNAYSSETWSIQYSDDNSSWSNATTGFQVTAAGWNDASFSSVGSHRYWRAIVTTQVNGEYYTEYRVYGTGTYRNANDWTPNNISTTAGATYDSMTDVPTLTSATAANYCVLNPLNKGSDITVSKGNLSVESATDGSYSVCYGTIGVSSGKWYWEQLIGSYNRASVGVAKAGENLNSYLGSGSGGYAYNFAGEKQNNGSNTAYGATYTTGDVIGVALDCDAGTITFYKNNSSQGVAFSSLSGEFFPAISDASSGGRLGAEVNFGQRPFSYTPPTGFKALNTFNLPDPTIKKPNQYMDVSTWSGDNAVSRNITGVAFNPDLVWAKQRNGTGIHLLWDAVRAGGLNLQSQSTDAEYAYTALGAGGISGNTTGGFTVAKGSIDSNYVNGTGGTYVGWQWKESATAGFDIVTYTGTGSARTVSHNLGVAPAMIIVKRRDAVSQWDVYHKSIGATGRLYLNATDATNTSTAPWNDTAPTSSVFTVGTATDTNASGSAIVAYLFAEIAGFSKFGSYTGNGSADGPFVYCGFRPKYIMVKASSTGGTGYNWVLYDTSRSPYNVADLQLAANLSDAEAVSNQVDILSNGFKVFGGGTRMNGSGTTYIYAAFAENPFKYSNAR